MEAHLIQLLPKDETPAKVIAEVAKQIHNPCPLVTPKSCPFVNYPQLLDYFIDNGLTNKKSTNRGKINVRFLYKTGDSYILYQGAIPKDEALQLLMPALQQQVVSEEELHELQSGYITIDDNK